MARWARHASWADGGGGGIRRLQWFAVFVIGALMVPLGTISADGSGTDETTVISGPVDPTLAVDPEFLRSLDAVTTLQQELAEITHRQAELEAELARLEAEAAAVATERSTLETAQRQIREAMERAEADRAAAETALLGIEAELVAVDELRSDLAVAVYTLNAESVLLAGGPLVDQLMKEIDATPDASKRRSYAGDVLKAASTRRDLLSEEADYQAGAERSATQRLADLSAELSNTSEALAANTARQQGLAAQRALTETAAGSAAEQLTAVHDEFDIARAELAQVEYHVLLRRDQELAALKRELTISLRTLTLGAWINGLDFPMVVYDAFLHASSVMALERPQCAISWPVLAAISSIESSHGTYGASQVDAAGQSRPAILGPQLNGVDFAAIADTDGGALDGDPVWDRAVGPMQFLPGTWAAYGRDGNGDAIADPTNYFDASLAAAQYLCFSGGNLATLAGLRTATYAYNPSWSYVAEVVERTEGYAATMAPPTRQPAAPTAGPPSGSTAEGDASMAYALPVAQELINVDPSLLRAPHHDYPAWDFPLASGSPVYAPTGGTAEVVLNDRCGIGVQVSGRDGFRYLSCHLEEALIDRPTSVIAGQQIGRSGSTGNSTGPHLHLQIRRPDEALVCPQPLLESWYAGAPMRPADASTDGCVSTFNTNRAGGTSPSGRTGDGVETEPDGPITPAWPLPARPVLGR